METFANRYDEMPYEDMLKELSQDDRLQLARERLKAGRDFDYRSAAMKMLEAKAPRTRDDAAIAANDNWPTAEQRERQRIEGVNRMETAKAVGQAVAGQISEAEQELADSDAELLRRRKADKRNLETASQGRWDYDYAETGNVAIPELKAISALKRAADGNITEDDIEKVKDEYASHYDGLFSTEAFQQQDKALQQQAMQHRADMMQALADVQRGIRLTPEKLSLLEEASHAYNRFMLGTVRGLAGVGKWVADAYLNGGALDQMPGVHGRTAKDDLRLSGASEKAGRLAEGAARAMKEDPSAVESRAASADSWNLNRAVSLGVTGTLSTASALVGTVALGPTAGLVSTIGVPTFGNSYAEADEALKRKYPTLSNNARFVLATQEAGLNAATEIGTEYASDMLGLGVIGGVGMRRPVEAFMADTTKRGARKFFGGVARNIKNMAIGTFAEWMEEAVADPLEDLAKAYRGESEIAGALKGKDKAANLAGYITTSWRDALLGVASIPLMGVGSAGLQAMQKRNNVTNALADPEFLKEFGVKGEYVTSQLSNAIRRAVVGDRQGAEGIMQTLEGMGKDELHNVDVNSEDVATARKIFDQVAKTTALGSNELLESLSANPLPYNGHARVDAAPIGDSGFYLVSASLDDEVVGMAVTPTREDALMLQELSRTRWLGVESPNVKALDGARYAAKVDGKWMTFDQYGHKMSEMGTALSTRMETEVARQLNKLPREYSLADKDGNIGVHVGGPAMMNGRQISVNEWGRTADNRPQWMIRGNMDDLDWVRNNAEGLEFVPGENENVLLVAGANPWQSLLGAAARESNILLGGHAFSMEATNSLGDAGRTWRVFASPEDLLWLSQSGMRLQWDGKSTSAILYNADGPAAVRKAIDPNGDMEEEKIETTKSEPEAEWAATLPGYNPKRLVGYMKTLPDAERNAALKFFGDGETIAFYPDEDGEMKAGTRQQCVEDSVANGVALRDNGKDSYTFIYRNGTTMPVNKAAYDYAVYLRGEQPAQPTAKPEKKTTQKAAEGKQADEPPAQNPPNEPPAETPSARQAQAITAADVVGAEMDDLQAEVQELQSKVDAGRATDEEKSRLADAKEEQAELEELAANVPPEEKDTVSGKGAVRRLKVDDIKVDPKRFQFKTGTDASGVERSNELTGEWDDKTAGNLYVWQDKGGDFYVVNGHHRLDLAKRKGVKEINAIVEREADGVTEEEAKRNGVMINIRDGQGTVEDYARFIHGHKMTEGQARAEGFFRGRKGGRGWQGWLIGSVASEALYSEFINGGITAEKAAAIVEVTQGDEGLEAAGIRLAATMDAASLQEAVKALRQAPKKKPVQGDLFGFDDSAIRTAEAIGRLVAKRKAALRREISSVRGAVKRPDLAENLDVAVGSEASAMLQQKQQELERLEHYDTDHELYQELLKEATEQQKPAEKPKAEEKPESKKEEAKPAEQPKAEEKPAEKPVEQPKPTPKPAEKPVEQPAASNELTQEEIDSIPGEADAKKNVVEYLNSLPADKREAAMEWLAKQARKSGNPRYRFVEGLIEKGYKPSDNQTMVSNNDTVRLTAALHEYAKWLDERRQPQKQEKTEPTKPEPTNAEMAEQEKKIEDVQRERAPYTEYLMTLPPSERREANSYLLGPFWDTVGNSYIWQKIADGFVPSYVGGRYYLAKGDESHAVPKELYDYGKWLRDRMIEQGNPQNKVKAKYYLAKLKSGGKVVMALPSDKTFRQEINSTSASDAGKVRYPYSLLELENGMGVAVHSLSEESAEKIISGCLDDGWTVYHTTEENKGDQIENAQQNNINPLEEEQPPTDVAQTQQNVSETQQPEPEPTPEPTDQPIKNNTFFDKPWLTEEEIRNSGVTDENMILAAIDYINGATDNSVNQAAYVQVKIAIANKNKSQEFDPNTEKELHAILLSDKTSAQKRGDLEDYAKRHGLEVKAAQERVEEVLVTISTEISGMDITPREKFDRLVTLYNGQPTLDERTSSSIRNQAYSTPAPMAFALAHRIRLADGMFIYEPAGGNGMLVASAPRGNTSVNELQASRQAALKRQGFAKVTGFDATEYTPPGLYDREMMNPPFGNLDNAVFTDDGYKLTKIDHLIAYKALSALSDNGKAGIIVGANTKNMGGTGPAVPADWVFMNWLYRNFNVTENIIVDGKLYERQGAGYPVRVIVVEGRRETPAGDEDAPREVEKVNTWDEVWDRLNTSKPTPSKPKPTEQPAQPAATQEKPQASKPTPSKPKPTAQAAVSAPAAEVPSVPVPKSADAEEDAIFADIMADLQAFSDAGKGLHMNLFGFNDGQIAALTKLLWHGAQLGFHYIQKGIRTFADWLDAMDKKLHAAFKAYGLSEDNINEFYQDVWNTQYTHDGQRHTLAMWASELGQTHEVQAGEATGELNVRYQPASNSKPLDTVAPKYLADAMAASLNRLQEKVGNLDQYVMEQLGYDSLDELYDKLAGEQVDGVAMAINAMSNGDGFILGDQTGIGKGRQCAAVMRWAIRNGKIPIFVTERSNLFTDMYRDGLDVGVDFNPVIFAGSSEGNILDKDGHVVRRAMNSKARKEAIANLVAGGNDHNAVFVTYSQVSMPGSGQRGELGDLVTRRHCIVVLDEAHNAAGNSNRGRYFMQFLRWPDLPVLYASATFAKRPDNMPIYFRTSLRKAVDDIEALPIAIRLGGVPLQQVVSRQLAEDGLFIRRERDFSGVEFENVSEEPPNYPEVLANHDRTVKVLQEMIEFSNLIRDILAQQNSYMQAHTREAVSIVSTPFSSVAHNYIAQLLLASKIDLVVERAIKSFKENEKPVIALTSTIESSIDNYMHDNGVQTGDRADMTYSDILLAALERMRRATRKSGNGQDVQEELDFEKMGIQSQYLTLKGHIKALADIKYPVSPIDYLRYKLTQAGMKIGEITGRTGGIDYSGKVPVFYSRNAEDKNKNGNINGFNNGMLDALILNQSGSTGLSIHASIKFRDQRVRRMIMAQPSLDINVVMQMFGRIMRSGQVVLPKYEILSTPLAAEKRPHMILSQKMKSLNANTTANSHGIVDLGVDFLNEIGDQVANDMLIENPTLAARIGVPAVAVHTDDNGNTVGNLENMARKVSGKMAILTNSEQEKYYKEIQDRYEEQVELLKAAGEYKLEAEDLDWEAEIASSDTELSPGVTGGSMFEQPVLIRHLRVREKRKIPSWKSVQNRVEKNFDGKDVSEYIAGKLEEAEGIVAALPEKYAQLHADGIAGTAPDQARDVVDACANLLAEVKQFFYDHPVDRVYILKAGEMEYQAYLTGFKLERANAMRPYIPSRVKLEYMVDSNVGKINIPFSQIQSDRYSFDPTFLRPEDVFLGDERVFRLNKTVIVGNLLRGFDAAQRGRIVNYTMADGSREIGIMMPNKWDESDLAHDPRRDLSGIAEIMEELKRAEAPDNVYIMSSDSLIRINAYADKAYMVVSKHGGRYIRDDALVSILGEFTGRRGSPMMSKKVPIEGETGADMKSAILRLLDMGVKFRRELPDASQPQANYKVSNTPETVMPTAEARKAVNSMRKEYNVPITLVEDETELPENLRRQIDIDRARGVFDNNKTWKGLYSGNRVYVNAEAAESAEDVVITVLHEAGVHAGLRAMFPDAKAFESFLNEMYDKYGAIRALARRHEQTGANRMSAIEEAIADMADRYNHNPVWRQILLRVYDAIRNLLAKIGVPVSDLVAIRNVIRDAAMAVKRNTPPPNDTVKYRADSEAAIAELDRRYMDAVNSGDMETAQKMVNDMAGRMLDDFNRLQDDSDVVAYKYHRGPAGKPTHKMYAVFNVTPQGFRAAYAGTQNTIPAGVVLDAQNIQSYQSTTRTDDSGVPLAYIPGATGGTAKEKGLDVAALPKELRNSRWLLERGGKHGSDIPNFAQMNVRNPETGKMDALPHNKLVFEVECYTTEGGDITEKVNNGLGRMVKGKNQGVAKIQPGQFYYFKTNSNAVGNWGIAGTFKITRLVPYEEIERVSKEKGVPVQKWIGGYHPEDFGLTTESFAEQVRQGERKKLMDAVTYDDNGQVIPLSQRFNPDIADARYRLSDGVQSVMDVTTNGTVHRTVTDNNGDVLEVETDTKTRRYVSNLRQLFKRYFSWGRNRGGVDASINEAMFRATSEIAAQNEAHRTLALDMVKTAKTFIDEPWAEEVHEAASRLWNGDFDADSLAENMPHYDDPRVVAFTEAVLQMRGNVDILSHQTENIAKINPAVRQAIEDNLGSYHFRAYRIHRDKNWKPSEKVRLEAVTAVADELMSMVKSTESAVNQAIETEYNNILNQLALSAYVRTGDATVLEGKSKRLRAKARMIRRLMDRTMKAVNDGMTVVMNQGIVELRPDADVISKTANGIIARLLDKNSNPQYIGAGSSAWKIIQTSFMRRKDLPQWLRELYGEVTDLGMQFEMTARRLTSIVVMDRMYRELAAFNEGLSKEDKQRSFYKTEYRRDGIDFMKKLEGPKFGALQGMYTDANTYELLTGYETPDSPIGKKWRQVVAWNRYLHTVANPPTQLRNILGNVAFAMNDGEILRPTYGKYMYYAFKTLIGSDAAATQERQRLMRLGLIGSSAHGVEIFQTVEAMGLKPHEFELGELLSKTGRVQRVLRWLPRKLGAAYAMEDNIFRVAALYAKEARGESSEEAVERIRDLYPTYDQAPTAMAALSRYIPTGKDFLTFQAEAVRCYVNSLKYMVKDMKKGSAWSTAGVLGVLALAMPMVQTFIGSMFGDDDDDKGASLSSEEFKALRMLLPEYMKDHAVIPWRTGKKIAYVDLGYIYPFDFLPTIFSVAMSNESMAVRAGDLAKDAMFGTFFGGMTSNLLAEQIVGRDARSGRKLSNVDRLEHIVSGMTPSSWRYAARAVKLAAAEEDELVRSSGEVQTAKSEAAKVILPLRVYHKDMAASYLYKMRTQATEVKTEKARANLAWRRVESKEGTRGDAEATQKSVQSRLEGDLYENIRLLNEAGAVYLSRGERMKLLRDAGFSLADVRAILDNKPIRYVRP